MNLQWTAGYLLLLQKRLPENNREAGNGQSPSGITASLEEQAGAVFIKSSWANF